MNFKKLQLQRTASTHNKPLCKVAALPLAYEKKVLKIFFSPPQRKAGLFFRYCGAMELIDKYKLTILEVLENENELQTPFNLKSDQNNELNGIPLKERLRLGSELAAAEYIRKTNPDEYIIERPGRELRHILKLQKDNENAHAEISRLTAKNYHLNEILACIALIISAIALITQVSAFVIEQTKEDSLSPLKRIDSTLSQIQKSLSSSATSFVHPKDSVQFSKKDSCVSK